jgi:hypothetical protein
MPYNGAVSDFTTALAFKLHLYQCRFAGTSIIRSGIFREPADKDEHADKIKGIWRFRPKYLISMKYDLTTLDMWPSRLLLSPIKLSRKPVQLFVY